MTCETVDPECVGFRVCEIKAVSRYENKLNIDLELKKPFKNFSIHFAAKPRFNGWKPFLYTFKLDDGSSFMKSCKNILVNLFFDMIRKYSNMNHSCPYSHDLLSKDVPNTEVSRVFAKLPVPSGEYLLKTIWILENVVRSKVNIFVSTKE